MSLLLAILGFGFLVLVHELGHYFAARWNGVFVEEFAIGMGPTLISKTDKNGTIWSIKALPIGGMCQMKGEDTGEEDHSSDSFQSKHPLRRMSIIFAGPLMNLIIGFIFFTILAQNMGFQTNRVAEVIPDPPAASIGLQPGDEIIEVGGNKSTTFNDVITFMAIGEGEPTTIKVRRNGTVTDHEITPSVSETGQFLIGYRPIIETEPNLIESFRQGINEAASMVRQVYLSLKLLVTGQVGMDQMGGPVAILGLASQVAQTNFLNFVRFIGFLSVNLAVFNLLPFPALDGGWLLMLSAELISGKKIPEKFMMVWNGVGFAILMLFMLVITFKDIFFPPAF